MTINGLRRAAAGALLGATMVLLSACGGGGGAGGQGDSGAPATGVGETGSDVAPGDLLTPLVVRVNDDNQVEKESTPPVYRKRFAVIVTDRLGNGVANAQVSAKLIPVAYRHGNWVPTTDRWVLNAGPAIASEDQGFDGVCSSVAEDTNRDGYLTPGNVASVSASALTSTDGVGEVVVTYPQGFAMWVQSILEVTIVSGGSETKSTQTFWLPIAASDVSSVDTPPPGDVSPFPYAPGAGGTAASCPSA